MKKGQNTGHFSKLKKEKVNTPSKIANDGCQSGKKRDFGVHFGIWTYELFLAL